MSVTLDAAKKAEYKEIKRLFKMSFPKEERAPFFLLKNRVKKRKAQLLAIKAGERLAGFLFLVADRDLTYIMFFAVEPSMRGLGIGSGALAQLKKKEGARRLFLCREELDKNAGNYEERVLRRDFYVKAGFKDMPLKIREGKMIYDVMASGGDVKPGEYDSLIYKLTGHLMRRFFATEMYGA